MKEIIFSSNAKLEAEFSAAITGIITSTAHGLSNGDVLRLTTSDTLPSGLSVSTNYYVIEAETNTFKLSSGYNGGAVTIIDTGTGTHTFHLKGKVILTKYFTDKIISLKSSGVAGGDTLTMKIKGSIEDYPEDFDFSDASSITNNWDYVESINKDDTTTVYPGSTGISFSGANGSIDVAVNDDALSYITVEISTVSDPANNRLQCEIRTQRRR